MPETDDIVARLRDRVAARPEFVPEGSVGHLIYEAADEIERLRDQVTYWRDIANGQEDHPVPRGVRRVIGIIEKALDGK